MYGTKETRDVLEFVKALISAFETAMSDGGINYDDLPLLFSLYAPAKEAAAGIEEVPKELLDLDDEELADLRDRYGDIMSHPAFKYFWTAALNILAGVKFVIIEDIDGT